MSVYVCFVEIWVEMTVEILGVEMQVETTVEIYIVEILVETIVGIYLVETWVGLRYLLNILVHTWCVTVIVVDIVFCKGLILK